ncbi:basal cell adhesion molecule isoform X2 [Erpetoichthys calabaricus]|uniref:basal cell adhesion molecule isoform X2 n=1 Tax=Erpetoichthys calabaricus TaxID=27687 RepID=UPI0010A00448|nr:basal cell adhesion molecule isoform X2 [Erpetoichthys calabaricus]
MAWTLRLGLTLTILAALQGAFAAVLVSVPSTQEAEVGKPFSIPCTFTTNGQAGEALVEWFIVDRSNERIRIAYRNEKQAGVDKNTEMSERISVDKDSSLVISPVELTDERTFYCQVTAGIAGSGEGISNLRVFNAPEAPEVTPQTQSISVTEDTVSEVGTCTSKNGYPAPKIIWFKDSNMLEEVTERNDVMYMASRVVKEASGMYSVSSILYLKINKKDKDSQYHCQVQYTMPNGKSEIKNSEKFKLTVHYYTEVVTFDVVSPLPIKEGDDVTMRCVSDGNPTPEFDFLKLEGENTVEKESNSGNFTLRSVSRADSGTYVCEALDFDSPEEVNLKKQLEIFVNYLDPVTIKPAGHHSVQYGKDLTLNCNTSGSVEPMLMWKKGKQVVSHSGTLALKDVSFALAGKYKCVASVQSIPGLMKEASVNVSVYGKPIVLSGDTSVSVSKEGSMVSLSCSAEGHPAPQISWNHTGEQSLRIDGHRVTSHMKLAATKEVLKNGVTCEARNEYGASSRTFMVVPDDESTKPKDEADRQEQGGSSTAVIAVVVCVLLLLILVGFLYFLQKKGKLPCGRKEKKVISNSEANTDEIVVEMKAGNPNEQAGLLNANRGRRQVGDEC